MAAGGAKAGGKGGNTGDKRGAARPPIQRPAKPRRPPGAKRMPVPVPPDPDPDAELYEQGDIATPRRDPPYEDGL
jgi:hypothetical protein